MYGHHQGGAPELYDWDVEAHGAAGGVTDDEERALRRVRDELADAPRGTRGIVRRVGLPAGDGPYLDQGTVAVARRDETSGAVVWG